MSKFLDYQDHNIYFKTMIKSNLYLIAVMFLKVSDNL